MSYHKEPKYMWAHGPAAGVPPYVNVPVRAVTNSRVQMHRRLILQAYLRLSSKLGTASKVRAIVIRKVFYALWPRIKVRPFAPMKVDVHSTLSPFSQACQLRAAAERTGKAGFLCKRQTNSNKFIYLQ